MSLRWKLLLLLLVVSITPVLTLRLVGQESIRRLGDHLAERAGDALVHQTTYELRRMVEDHARIIRSERQLVEALLRTQAERVALVLGGAGVFPGAARPFGATVPGAEASARHCRLTPAGCLPQDVANGAVSVWGNPDAASALTGLGPELAPLAARRQDLVLWQWTLAATGAVAAHPALSGPVTDGRMPAGGTMGGHRRSERPRALADLLRSLRVTTPRQGADPVWTGLVTDPLTNGAVLVASLPVAAVDGTSLGLTAVAVPADAFLHENAHVRRYADTVDSFLVRVPGPSALARLEVEAEEGAGAVQGMHGRGMGWRRPEQRRALEVGDADAWLKLAADMRRGQADVVGAPHRGASALWAYAPIAGSGLSLLLIVPLDAVVAEAEVMRAAFQATIERQIELTGLILVGVLLAVVAAAFILSRSFTRTIKRLSNAAARLAGGDFEARVERRADDELGRLADAFNAMGPALREHFDLKEALDVAEEVQQSLLPQTLPDIPGYELAGASRYCDQTGGDYYDAFSLPNQRHVLVVGDVSGHGMASALLMASARASLRSLLDTGAAGGLGAAMASLNDFLARDLDGSGRFMTLFAVELDPATGSLRWVRAGHDPALLVPPQGAWRELRGEGMALGVLEDQAYRAEKDLLPPGGLLALATDGLWEARDKTGNPYGKQRLHRLLASLAGRSAVEALDAVMADLDAFLDGAATEDDVTLLLVRRKAV